MYIDLMELEDGNIKPRLPDFIYDYYVQVNGSRETAEKKILDLFVTMRYYRKDTRAKLFMGFFKVPEEEHYHGDSLVLILECIREFKARQKENESALVFNAAKRMVTVVVAQEVICAKFEWLSKERVHDIKGLITKLYTDDTSRIKKNDDRYMNCVNIDKLFFFLVTTWEKETAPVWKKMLDVIEACNVGTQKIMPYSEFNTIMKFVTIPP